jgi:DNA-binding NtrC family response regulator
LGNSLHDESIALFFQTFSRHLERIRDEGQDASQSYRAQILMGQLQLFEKAVLEYLGGGSARMGSSEFDALLAVRDFKSLVSWLCGGQQFLRFSSLFFLNDKGVWERLYGQDPFDGKVRIGEWVTRGLLASVESDKPSYVAYVFGQPRLVFQMAISEELVGSDMTAFLNFVAHLCPLFIYKRAKLPSRGVPSLSSLIAVDTGFLEQLDKIGKAAKKDVSILLEGESGTGKEVIANFIHRHSSRFKKPMVAVNCAAIPAGLIESELFGHEKGAFTGAHARQIGRVEEADGGTLFLDEIGEMELAMQAKLLRFLQLHEFHRVGGKQKITVDVRIVAATNRNLKAQVQKGEFREDLYYRLSVMPFYIPALRERVDDIVPLAQFFFKKYAEAFKMETPNVDPLVYQKLASYDFPGNVRELENLIQNILVVAQGTEISATHLPENIQRLEALGEPLRDGNDKPLVWRKRSSRTARFKKLNRPVASSGESLHKPWLLAPPGDNEALKEMKQGIQDFATELTLELEHAFLKSLLNRADGSMPLASDLGKINRTLLYKMIDRTKHLDG